MQILWIHPFASLSEPDPADLHELIADLLEELAGIADWMEQDPVVYVTNMTEAGGSLHRIVAPRSADIRPGDWITATRWTGTLSISTGRATVHAAYAVRSVPGYPA